MREFADLVKEVYGILQDAVELSGSQQARMLQFSTGISYDPRCSTSVRRSGHSSTLIPSYANSAPPRNGTGALIARWTATPGATIADLIGAMEESYLFSGDRAVVVGETEITRAFAAGQYLGAGGDRPSGGRGHDGGYGHSGRVHPCARAVLLLVRRHIIYDDANQHRRHGHDVSHQQRR